jgi:anti-sigma B factor antagonist
MTHSVADEASRGLPSPADRGGYVVATLRGELGIASAHALREQLLGLLRAASVLIIDLSAVGHADASGLAVLVSSGHRARLLGGSLRLVAPSPQVARFLSAAGVNRHLDIFATVRAAITGQPELPEPIVTPAAVRLAASASMTASRARLRARLQSPPGRSAIDLGCGPRGVLDLLAERSHRRAGSSAWTQTRRMPPWRPGSSPGGGWAAWRS